MAAVAAVAAVVVAAASAASPPILSRGPHGEKPTPVSKVVVTPAEVAKVKAKHATAAIVLHYGGNDWSTAQVAGLRAEFKKLGIRVVAVTDANFKPDKQVSDIETVLVKRPSIIVSIPTDPVATAAAYKKAARAGVKLVFMDNVPNGMKPGKDYVGVVSADNYGNGVAAAKLMCQALDGKGDIGAVYHGADFFVTRQRWDGFRSTIKKSCPGVKIVVSKGISGPDFAGDADTAAGAMLTRYQNLKGIWAVWDVPAEGVMSAARAAGRNDLVIVTEDLGKNVAVELARNGLVKGLGAQRPFDQGVTEAKLAAYGLLGKKAPIYVALPALSVTHANVLQAWRQVYHAAAPSQVQDSYKK
ncbi:MAG TPA: substrate-binding domain-containing protein [Gaiellaceae bacterium]|nr:substrate-binding domain-containing protein [Gaiellaceae bacterium]